MKVKRKRSNRSVWVGWDFPDVKIKMFDFSIKSSHFCFVLNSLKKMASQTCTKARLTSLSLLPVRVAWPAERRVEEREDEDVGRKSLYCPS